MALSYRIKVPRQKPKNSGVSVPLTLGIVCPHFGCSVPLSIGATAVNTHI